MDSLNDTLQAILAFRDDRDWSQFHTPRNLAAALTIEASELQETMLWKGEDEVRALLSEPRTKSQVQREIADVLIYALLLCHATGVDPINAVEEKLRENATKYPVHLAKGRATKYSGLDHP